MITFRKLYNRHIEGEASYAIIEYYKTPWISHRSREFGDYITTFRHRLKIDLWILVVDWAWERPNPDLNV